MPRKAVVELLYNYLTGESVIQKKNSVVLRISADPFKQKEINYIRLVWNEKHSPTAKKTHKLRKIEKPFKHSCRNCISVKEASNVLKFGGYVRT